MPSDFSFDVVSKVDMNIVDECVQAAMKEIGYAHGGLDNKPETLFDGVTFDPSKPEEYAKGFAVNNLKG